MKGFSRLFRLAVKTIFLFSLLIDESVTNPVVSKDITGDYCHEHHSLNSDVVKDSYHYISDEFRYNLCKQEYPDFDEKQLISQDYMKCLGPNHMLLSYKNPCEVVCLFEPNYNLEFGFMDENEEEICGKFRRQFSNISRTILIRDTDQRCGPNHFCNSLGCCAQRETTIQTTVETTPVPNQPKTDPTKVSPSTKINTAVNETTPTTEPTTETNNESTTPSPTKTPSVNETESPSTETVSEEPILSDNSTEVSRVTIGLPKSPMLCSAVGLYKLPNDPSNRKYYSCVLKAELMVCPFGQIFDEKLAFCVNIETTTTEEPTTTLPTTVSTTVPVIDWNKYFHCTKEGFFRNPYDCTRFYRCYKNQGDNRHIWLSTFQCPPNQLYDEKLETCDREEDFIRKHGVCHVEALPTLSSHH